eukprot:3932886-Rhodomonas_salina.3
MPGTELAYGATCLRSRYAMSGTEPWYGATRLLGTCIQRGLDSGTQHSPSLCCYAMCGTELGYAVRHLLHAILY